MCRSTCFGRLHAHHKELTTALVASGFILERGGSSVVGRGRANHDQQCCYRHATTVQPEAVNAVVKNLMMCVEAPETC
jgi:hypothetical protein